MVDKVGLGPASCVLHAREPDVRTHTCESGSDFEGTARQSSKAFKVDYDIKKRETYRICTKCVQ